MFEHQVKLRVRYAETDQMGYVYHGEYATYFEVARVEALRELGLIYKELEQKGVLLPVVDLSIRYLKPGLYDDEITIKTTIGEMPTSLIKFNYEAINQNGESLASASTSLAFINKESGRPMRPPVELVEALQSFL
jgi:acyl-CoA thioester hydrolase